MDYIISLADVVVTFMVVVFVQGQYMSEYKEPAYDCPLQLDENPAYEVMQK